MGRKRPGLQWSSENILGRLSLQIKVSRLMSLVSCRNKPAFHGHCQGPAHGKEALECVGGFRGPTAGAIRQFCFPHQEIRGTCFHGHHNHDSKVFGKTESLPSLCKGLSAFSVFCSSFFLHTGCFCSSMPHTKQETPLSSQASIEWAQIAKKSHLSSVFQFPISWKGKLIGQTWIIPTPEIISCVLREQGHINYHEDGGRAGGGTSRKVGMGWTSTKQTTQ